MKIGDICTKICSGGTPTSSVIEYYNGNIPWLNTKEICFNRVYSTEKNITQLGYESSAAKLIPRNSVIIAMYGATAAKCCINKIPLTTNQACCNLIIDEAKSDYNFVYYYMCSKYNELQSLANGAAQQNLNTQIIKDFELPSLSLTNQKAIAAVLSALDDKIEVNRAINKNLEATAQAIFKSWFIDFEPFGGIMPADWKKDSLSNIAKYTNGLAMQNYRPVAGDIGLPVLKIKELRQGMCDTDSELCSPSIKPAYIIHDGDVIFSWSGSLLVDLWCGGICGLNQHLFKVTSDIYDKWFYYSWTQHHLVQFQTIASAKATTMGHIKRGDLEKATVVIPSQEDYQSIGNLLRPIYDTIISNKVENKRLAEIRDALLPKLMSGEIDVSQVKI